MNNDTARLIRSARANLAIARALLSTGTTPALARVARRYIAHARKAWAHVQTALALGDAAMRHTYARAAHGWRAMVVADGATLWTSARIYGKRQSAQRAALRERGRMTIKAENVHLRIVLG